MKKNLKKTVKNLIIFLLIIFITFFIIFKDQDFTELPNILSNLNKKFVLIAILSMACYFVCDAINIGRALKKLGETSSFVKNIKYSLIGFFFSSVTPAASGGQPMQVYYMKKDGISIANSTLTFLINLSCMQIATISLAIVCVIFNGGIMNPVLWGCFAVGIFLNCMALSLLVISINSKRVTRWLIQIVIRILKFFKVKNIESKKNRLEKELEKYQTSAIYIKSNKNLLIKTLMTTYVQFLCYYSVTYWIYRAFGLTQYNAIKIISMQAILFATVSGIPSPGAVGVSEGGFIELFKNVYSKQEIGSAMLINRGVNFYLFVILSSIVVLICSIQDKKEKVNKKIEDEKECNNINS